MIRPTTLHCEPGLDEGTYAALIARIATRRQPAQAKVLSRDAGYAHDCLRRNTASVNLLLADQNANLGEPVLAIEVQLDIADVTTAQWTIADPGEQLLRVHLASAHESLRAFQCVVLESTFEKAIDLRIVEPIDIPLSHMFAPQRKQLHISARPAGGRSDLQSSLHPDRDSCVANMRASLNQILVAKAEERSGGNRVGATEMKAFGKMLGATAAT